MHRSPLRGVFPAIRLKTHLIAGAFCRSSRYDAIVPGIWAFEIANVIFIAFTKRRRISQQQIDEYLTRLRALPIRSEHNDLWANIALESQARKWNLPAYDVAYLDLALRKKLPLATADDDLRKTVQAVGIEVLA